MELQATYRTYETDGKTEEEMKQIKGVRVWNGIYLIPSGRNFLSWCCQRPKVGYTAFQRLGSKYYSGCAKLFFCPICHKVDWEDIGVD